MLKRKNTVAVFLLCLCACLFVSFGQAKAVEANEYSEYNASSEQYSEYYRGQIEASGADKLFGELDEETQTMLQQLGIYDMDFDNILNISPKSLLELFVNIINGKLKNPLKMFAEVLGIILVCALLDCLKVSFSEKSMGGLFSFISTLLIGLVVVLPLTDCISHVCSAIALNSKFMLVFIPVITALLCAAGRPVAASGLNLTVFAAAEVISFFSSGLLVPLLCVYLALSIVGGLSPDINLGGMSEAIKKSVNFILGLFSTVFVALVSLHSALSRSADTLTARTAKYLLGNFIPVVGGAIGDTVSTVQGCVGLTKNTVGAFGLIAALLIYLPVLAELLIWILCVQICSGGAALFGLASAQGLLKSVYYTLSLLMSVMIFCAVLLTVSTGIMVMMGGGGA